MIAKIIISFLFMTLGLCFTAKAQSSIRIQEIPQILKNPRAFLLANPDILKQQLSFILKSRCSTYVNDVQCGNAAKQLVEDLHIESLELEEPTTGKKLAYIITLTDELREIYKDPRLNFFLQDLETQLTQMHESINSYQFIAPKLIKPFDLGYFTMKHFGNFEMSLKVLATLLQDIPQSVIQVKYLYDTYGDTPTVRQLYKILQQIAELQNIRTKVPLLLFKQPFYGSKIYHALVPAYLANRLHARGYSAQTAFFNSFAFNYVYEAGEAYGNFKTYFTEPKSLPRTDTQDDIRAGEFGALLGVGHSEKFMPEEKARDLLTKSPQTFLSTLGKLIPANKHRDRL